MMISVMRMVSTFPLTHIALLILLHECGNNVFIISFMKPARKFMKRGGGKLVCSHIHSHKEVFRPRNQGGGGGKEGFFIPCTVDLYSSYYAPNITIFEKKQS